MKRKTKKGVKLLSTLIEKGGLQESSYLYPLLYVYRAYGHILLEMPDKALKDYIKSSLSKRLNAASYYNMLTCQGVLAIMKKEYQDAIGLFGKANQKFSKNRDPYFLRAVAIVHLSIQKFQKPEK